MILYKMIVLNNKVSKFTKCNRNEKRNKSTIIIGDCNIPISVIERTDGQNITKYTGDLNDTMGLLDSTPHPTATEYILLKTHRNSPGWTIQCFNKFKMSEIITHILWS